MKKYEKLIIPASERDTLVETTCDLCGDATQTGWRRGQFDAAETEVRMRTGESYPDNGGGDDTTIDICPKCFAEKLIPWVKSQGGNPTTKPWDW